MQTARRHSSCSASSFDQSLCTTFLLCEMTFQYSLKALRKLKSLTSFAHLISRDVNSSPWPRTSVQVERLIVAFRRAACSVITIRFEHASSTKLCYILCKVHSQISQQPAVHFCGLCLQGWWERLRSEEHTSELQSLMRI